ncbi:Arylformamidase [Alteripontixanthobacter maritimus]|uniref:Kynurenine formamidase n=1 Tax=Alteripontixanthobacter maritimus TaxID=2161824 RepID=A0A369Q9E9_9SPHN|nr:arylformamidase [Alteripontixanthobacter maritimus]RDC60980.1 Arylformamidase [Alteripontixanthobacter maritimus]
MSAITDDKRRIWDISQRLRPGLPVWPGDTKWAQERTWLMEDGSPVNVSKLTMTTHSGSHADAPLHYAADGIDAAAMDLAPFIGECLVVDARGAGSEVGVGDLPHIESADRVLFRTFDSFPHEEWGSNFTAIAPETIEWLALQGVRLIGTDAPSVDPQDSKSIAAHKAVLEADMRILEGLVLDDVPEGRYELIALPLKVVGGDAAPCRAILRELP